MQKVSDGIVRYNYTQIGRLGRGCLSRGRGLSAQARYAQAGSICVPRRGPYGGYSCMLRSE